MSLDPAALKADFPIFSRWDGDRPLVYLDNAATTQKPAVVLDAERGYYEQSNANVHRSVHTLGERATELYEAARERVARWLGAADPAEVVFVRNATEGLNLVAESYAGSRLGPGDEVVVSVLNHHSNLVPWEQAVALTGATLRVLPLTPGLALDMDAAADTIGPRTRIVALTHKSNVTGTVVDAGAIAHLAHRHGAVVVLDAAQSVPHLPVDVSALECDFLAFSAHKMCGPMGIGALWARRALLEEMPPYMTGGEMVREVTLAGATWNDVPWKFEAGTPNVAGAVGLARAIDYVAAIGLDEIAAHERALSRTARDRLGAFDDVETFCPATGPNGIVSFCLADIHPHDVATVLDQHGVAVRAGHHCAQPLHAALGVRASVRASFYLYNDQDDVARLVDALHEARRFFRRGRGSERPAMPASARTGGRGWP
jgi:cysteine desulfurase / selenocysteine lyase